MLATLIIAFVSGFSSPVGCVPDIQGHGGYTGPDRSVLLTQQVCDTLSKPTNVMFAYSLFTVVHESEHVNGITGEHAADCQALRDLPRVLKRFWPRLGSLWRLTVLYQARSIHAAQPAPYAGVC